MDPSRLKIIQPSVGVHTFIDIFVCVETGVERNTPSNLHWLSIPMALEVTGHVGEQEN